MELKLQCGSVAEPEVGLLIVPYGIETRTPDLQPVRLYSFNRTLWN